MDRMRHLYKNFAALLERIQNDYKKKVKTTSINDNIKNAFE